MNVKITSPLRYPGAKSNLIGYISSLVRREFPDGNCTIIEPYAGSAIISLSLVFNEVVSKAIIVERDPLIYAFWQAVFSIPDVLISNIKNVDVSIDTWHSFQKYRKATNANDFSLIEMAIAGLFFNRTNFSGILKANPLGGLQQNSEYKIDCRFNKTKIIKKIELIATLQDKVEVYYGDALNFMITHQFEYRANPCFLYIDPPYYLKGKSLYRYWYELEDHKQLSNFLLNLNNTVKWLVSYDNHSEIESLYSKNIKHQVHFDYSVHSRRSEKELLISNLEIPPWEVDIPKRQRA
ncbi:MAG: DNA adenine methylase [Syntrophomonas sp.]